VVPFFTLFAAVWIYLRHWINLTIIWSTFTTFRTLGPFELNWETEQYKCWISQYITFSLLAALQAMNIFWLYHIFRIAFNIVFANTIQDTRSDDEGTEEEAEKDKAKVSNGTIKAPQASAMTSAVEAIPAANGSPMETRSKTRALNGHTNNEKR
jgi:very-long-chain ceramide synthase